MARKRMVTRTVEQTTAQVMTLDVTTAEVQVCTYNIGGKYSDEDLLKNLQKLFQTDTFKLVHIETQRTEEMLLGIPEDEFIRLAQVLPARNKSEREEQAMDRETLEELKEIEDRLFTIRYELGTSVESDLTSAWYYLFTYIEELEKIKK